MGSVHPKQILQEAKDLEARGEAKAASLKYASLIPILQRRGKPMEVVELCEKALSLSPNSTRLNLTKALALMELKREREAFGEIEKFSQAAIRQERVTQYMEMAREKLGSYPKLLQLFLEKILEVDRTRGEVFFALAQVLTRLGKESRALELVLSGLITRQDEELGHRILKDLITKRGRVEDIKTFEKLINKTWPLEKVRKFILANPTDIEGMPQKDLSVKRKEDTTSELRSLDEENVDTLKDLIQELEEELGERPKGIETVSGLISEFKEKAEKVIDGDFNAFLDLAIAFKEMGLVNDAKELLSRVPVESEKYINSQALLGDIELELGSFMSALDIFQKVLRTEVLDQNVKMECLYCTAKIYIHLGEIEKAESYIEKVAEIDSHYRGLSRLRQTIKTKKKDSLGT